LRAAQQRALNGFAVHWVALRQPAKVGPPQHFHHHEIVVTIGIQISSIDTHGRKAAFPLNTGWHLSKRPMAIVCPEPVRTHEVVAHVKVRKAVPVQIPEQD
jgi:hypothetical protein